MSDSIVRQLILKDLRIMKVPILCYWVGGLTAILIAMGKSEQLGIMGLILFVAALAGLRFSMDSGVMSHHSCQLSPA